MKICYLLWDFTLGGAQIGLLNLLQNGLASQAKVVVVGVSPIGGGIVGRIPSDVRVIEIPRRSALVTFIQFCMYGYFFSRRSRVLMTSLYPATIAGRLIKILNPRIILVSLEHGTRVKNKLRRLLLSKTSALVALSMSDCRATLEFSKSIYAKQSKTRMDEIQLVALQPVDKKVLFAKGGNTLHLISVGRMVREKNYSYLLHELKILKNKNFDFTLSLIGDGPERRNLEELSSLLGIEDNIQFLGHRDNVDRYLSKADIYVQTSLTEGQCFTVAEAMAAGLPVVTTNVGGLGDYTVDGINCLHVNASREGAIVDAIVMIANDSSLAERVSLNSLETVRDKFSRESQKKSVEKMLGAIQRIIEGER